MVHKNATTKIGWEIRSNLQLGNNPVSNLTLKEAREFNSELDKLRDELN